MCITVACQTTETVQEPLKTADPQVDVMKQGLAKSLIIPAGHVFCLPTYADVIKITSYHKEYFIFKGLSKQGILYLFFLGKNSYSIFFKEATTSGYCTGIALLGEVIAKPGRET